MPMQSWRLSCAFQIAMQQRFIDQVERLTGRDVLSFISN